MSLNSTTMIPSKLFPILSGILVSALTLPATTITVTTIDNESPAGDGQTSLIEAIGQAQDGDTIAFNIPGNGPHYIATPPTGYPLIDETGITIDGYSQPGAQRNTNPITGPNNAVLRIVIDSRDGGRFSLAEYGSHGFGDSESAIFPLLDSAESKIQGLAFIGVPGDDNSESPFIYNIALIGASTDVKVQGCWFGLDPAAAPFAPDPDGKTPGVHGCRSAVASFKWDETTTSSGLIIGTDGDGVGDRGEFNIMVGNLLAIHLETPDVRVAGNYFNYLPDGRRFDIAIEQLDLHGADYEDFENGRGHDNIIGTNGDGISDSDEANFFGPVQYGVYLEFWRTAVNVTLAGNYFGISPTGDANYVTPSNVSLAETRRDSSIRIGSNVDGTADAAEANHFANFEGNFLKFHGSNNEAGAIPVRVSMRGNALQNNFGDFPINPLQGDLSIDRFYTEVILPTAIDPSIYYRPLIAGTSTPSSVRGTVPPPIEVVAPDSGGCGR